MVYQVPGRRCVHTSSNDVEFTPETIILAKQPWSDRRTPCLARCLATWESTLTGLGETPCCSYSYSNWTAANNYIMPSAEMLCSRRVATKGRTVNSINIALGWWWCTCSLGSILTRYQVVVNRLVFRKSVPGIHRIYPRYYAGMCIHLNFFSHILGAAARSPPQPHQHSLERGAETPVPCGVRACLCYSLASPDCCDPCESRRDVKQTPRKG